jgi:hypothetical protein
LLSPGICRNNFLKKNCVCGPFRSKNSGGYFGAEIETGNMLPGVYFLKYADNKYAETIKRLKTE